MQSYSHTFQFFDEIIHTEVTRSHQFVEDWLVDLNHVIGEFNITQGKPFFVGFGVEFANGAVATIQLCYDNKWLIYHMSGEDSFPLYLKNFLFSHPSCVFVGFGLELPQLDILRRQGGLDKYMGYQCVVYFAQHHIIEEHLSLLATVVLQNLDVVRPQPCGRWDSEVLSDKQIEYASIGAHVSRKIAMLLWRVHEGHPPLMIEYKQNEVEDEIEQVHEVQILNKTVITTVTKRLIAVENWIASVIRDRHLYNCVGFDVQSYTFQDKTRIGTVQFCVDTRCLIIQFALMNGRYLPMLEHFLLLGNNTFVGINIKRKMEMLKDALYFKQGGPLRVIDLGVTAAIALRRPGLRYANQDAIAAAWKLFAGNLVRPLDVENDWDRPLLSDAQVQNACINAAASYEIGRRFLPGPN